MPGTGAWGRVRSGYYGFWLAVSEGTLRGRARPVLERPAEALPALAPALAERVAALRERFGAAFEAHLDERHALGAYAYLDWLAQGFDRAGLEPPQGGTVCDVGCASFWYARALSACFAPRRLVGIEVEGGRRLRGGHRRRDAAAGYLQGLDGAEFRVGDYRHAALPADVVTAFFPFVSPAPVLAWRLPLSLLAPAELFSAIARNLLPGGVLVLVNQGEAEARVAAAAAASVGLVPRLEPGQLQSPWPRPQPTWLSLWQVDGARPGAPESVA